MLIIFNFQDQLEFAKVKGSPILVSVYYECLCPDSKNFILKQLKSAYSKLPDLMEIEFFPYGKATTSEKADGMYSGAIVLLSLSQNSSA